MAYVVKVAFDLDGTLLGRDGNELCAIMAALAKAGHEVGVLTGRPRPGEVVEKVIIERNGCPPPQFWYDRSGMNEEEDRLYLRDPFEAIYRYKLRRIREEHIDLAFDDDARALHRRDPSAKLVRPY